MKKITCCLFGTDEKVSNCKSQLGIDIVLACLYAGATGESQEKLRAHFNGVSSDITVGVYTNMQKCFCPGLCETILRCKHANPLFMQAVNSTCHILLSEGESKITNIIHVKDTLHHHFPLYKIGMRPFEKKQVPTMMDIFMAEYYCTKTFAALKLPLKTPQYSILYVLPKRKNVIVSDVEAAKITRNMDMCMVNVQIPQIEGTFNHNLTRDIIGKYGNQYDGIYDGAQIAEFTQKITFCIAENDTNTIESNGDNPSIPKFADFVANRAFMYYVMVGDIVLFSGYYC